MTQRRQVRLLVAIVLIAGLFPATIGTLIEAKSISARSIEGQDGWSGETIPVSASVDQVVDQSGVNQRTGTGAWRISNNTSKGGYNGDFAGWPFGPGLPVSAGQPSSGAAANQFTATLWFRSASATADGSNIEIDLGSDLGDDRNTFLAVTNRADADGGLQLRVSEPDGATGDFRPPTSSPRESHAASTTASTSLPNSRTGRRTNRRIRTGWSPARQSRRRHHVRHLRGLLREFTGQAVPPEQPPVLPLGRSPECLWRIRRHGRPGLLLRRPVLLGRAPVGTGHPAGRLCDGVRAGLLRRFDPGPGSMVRRNDPDRRERRPGR